MKPITIHEKIAENSRDEIERITFLLHKYSDKCHYFIEDSLAYLMGECGYRKINYIPCAKEDLQFIASLSISYMRKYAIKPERFVQTVLEVYDYCKIHGYSEKQDQTVLQLGEKEW